MSTILHGHRDQESAVISVAIGVLLISVVTTAMIIFFVYALPLIQDSQERRSTGLKIDTTLPY